MNAPAEAELTDHELLQAHVDGDQEAFSILFRRHRDRLWAVALRTMGNPEDLSPAAQVQADTATTSVELDDAPTGRYVTIWLTSLPAVSGGFKGGIVDLVVAGA